VAVGWCGGRLALAANAVLHACHRAEPHMEPGLDLALPSFHPRRHRSSPSSYRARDGDRHRAGGRARGDAPFAQPGDVVGELAVHLVLSRNARAGPDLLLVQPQRRPAARGAVIPGTDIGWQTGTNSLISAFIAATLGLGLNEAAYMAEIVRAGIISVEAGQTEAAQALGMNRLLVMRRIILPQAMRVIIRRRQRDDLDAQRRHPWRSSAAVPELFTRSQQVSNVYFTVIEMRSWPASGTWS